MKNFIVSFLLTTGFLAYAGVALAVSPSSILVDVNPPSPEPGSNVTISLRSFSANLDIVQIVWSVNNSVQLSGVGEKTFSITAGPVGSTTTVRVRILLPDGEIEKTVLIKPATMVLLWQADGSYVPPFYKGKALPVADSKIKVVAFPEIKNSTGVTVNPKNISYDWKKNYTNESSGSGYGKNYFVYSHSFLDKSNTILVTALTPDQKNTAEGKIDISAYSPEIVFYKQDPTYGTLWERALPDSYQIFGEETIVAIPYFVYPKDLIRPDFIWNWYIDGILVENNNLFKNALPIQAGNGGSGFSRLKLELENKYNIFQKAEKEINIQF